MEACVGAQQIKHEYEDENQNELAALVSRS
jgi:hypothetical protein